MMSQITIIVPFVEAVEKIPGYAKFMKDLVTKKKCINFETVKVTHQCSAIISRTGVKKMEDPGAFTIRCTIGVTSFAKALCDLGASINLMPYDVFKKLGLGYPRPTTMKLLMADHTLKKLLAIIDDILVKVDRLYFLADFVILDCEVDREVPIILGRPFLATGRAICDVEAGELKFHLNDEEVIFQIQKSMKQPHDYGVISVVDIVDEMVEDDREEFFHDESLKAVLLNSKNEAMEGYIEAVMALEGFGSHSYKPEKLSLDMENRVSPPTKPFNIEPPKLELKTLPSHLRVSKQGIEVDRAKIEVITKFPPLNTVKGVTRFLGHAGFYRRFIKDFSKLVNTLCKLLEKDAMFNFDEACMIAFEELK
uniref:Uncharacterized protein n=1 Tax=Nicotiana tabacum TaxID=4097 RepID=A0A1S3Z077_TOBAC|nr:PREDICTED: uncharacterized protein LOC107781324 [Nicotiana tabacum]